jgi:hypothetical protein
MHKSDTTAGKIYLFCGGLYIVCPKDLKYSEKF